MSAVGELWIGWCMLRVTFLCYVSIRYCQLCVVAWCVVDWLLSVVRRCPLFGVRCLLSVVGCVSCVVCRCSLSVVCCSLCVGGWFFAWCRLLLFGVCCLPFVVRHSLFVVGCW